MNVKIFLKKHLALILPYILFLMVGLIILLAYSKTDIHLYINRMNTPFLDVFFKYITEFGAFILIAPIIVATAFIRYRYALIAIASSLLATLFTQILKRWVYYDSPRPKVVFQDICDLHLVENVHLHSNHSFPSGHTAGAFSLFIVLALINKRPVYQFFFLMVAVLVGYSRMYLSQHFLEDVVVGSAVGTVSAFISYIWLNSSRNTSRTWMDKSILTSLEASIH